MDLQVSYDSSTAAAPSYLQSAVNYVISQYDALFTNPITVKINLGWGEENGNAINPGAVATNQSNGTYMSYASLTKALAASATTATDQTAIANLPAADFTNGGRFYVPLAEQKAIGIQSATSGEVDGYVGLDSTKSYTFSTTGQIAAGTYDIVSVLEHEISQTLGRVDFAGQDGATGVYTPMELFRYAAAGQRSTTSGSGSFSIDGQTMLQSFGNSGDASDWNGNIVGDVYDNVTAGVAGHFSAVDFTMMDVLGYNLNTSAVTASAPTATAQASGPAAVTTQPAYGDYAVSQGGNETFVFQRHPGDVAVAGLVTSGTSPDTLDLSATRLNSVAAVLHQTQMLPGEAVIHLSKTDMIELVGVTKADLRANPGIFSFG